MRPTLQGVRRGGPSAVGSRDRSGSLSTVTESVWGGGLLWEGRKCETCVPMFTEVGRRAQIQPGSGYPSVLAPGLLLQEVSFGQGQKPCCW